ncbi:MAG: glycosyltransferase, partial [Sedimentisphaerales bacterium]|nr:glycosyltransferase [Sedimentisphaerales bacterium]
SEIEDLLQGKRFILFLGRIAKVKGLDILIKAFANMDRSLSDLILVVAGPDEDGYLSSVKQIVADSGLNGRVIFTGSVSGNTKRYLLKNARLFALTSYGEGLPMAVLEAMACSVPVLITHPCNIPEVARCHAGMVVEPQVSAIIAGLNYLLLQADKQQMGENGKKLVAEKFTWQQVARQTQLLCQQVLQERR